jgi:hypothetical protein
MNVSFSEVTILLSQTVFSLLVANHITKTSEAVPLLGRLTNKTKNRNWNLKAKRTMSWCNHRWLEFLSIFSLAATGKRKSQGTFRALSHTQNLNDEERHFLQLHLSTEHFIWREKSFQLLLLLRQTCTHSVTHFAHAVTPQIDISKTHKSLEIYGDINFKPKKLWTN